MDNKSKFKLLKWEKTDTECLEDLYFHAPSHFFPCLLHHPSLKSQLRIWKDGRLRVALSTKFFLGMNICCPLRGLTLEIAIY